MQINSLHHLVKYKIHASIEALRDFRTNRQIVVFESDDWGSIRMSSRKAWEKMRSLGYAVDRRPYERFDTLESSDDMEALFSILHKHKDGQGKHPTMTANMLMANPNFEKIAKSDYKEYFYESIADTYTRYYGDIKVLELMKQGCAEGLFVPQSHGREHFNVDKFMAMLQAGNADVMTAFHHGMCGIAPLRNPEQGNNLMQALNPIDERAIDAVNARVREGLHLFEHMWGFKSKTFVAPCYAWHLSTENVLAEEGVRLIQASRLGKFVFGQKERYFHTGQKSKKGLVYSVRNCEFEPSTSSGDVVDKTMKEISQAFSSHRLAIISTHRINYVSGIKEKNRQKSLSLLNQLLQAITIRFPNVEFLSSNQLLDFIP